MFDQLIQDLQERYELEDDFITKMEVLSELEDMKIKAGKSLPPKPIDSSYECIGCSS